ncbi:unnamed protein product [Mortierella alpina]
MLISLCVCVLLRSLFIERCISTSVVPPYEVFPFPFRFCTFTLLFPLLHLNLGLAHSLHLSPPLSLPSFISAPLSRSLSLPLSLFLSLSLSRSLCLSLSLSRSLCLSLSLSLVSPSFHS